MGLDNENSSEIFLTIFQGMMARRVAEGTPDSKMRIKKGGDEVHELHFDTLNGYLDDIKLEDPPDSNPQWGKSWIFMIEDGNDVFKLRLGAKGREAHAFLARLPKIDFSQPIKIKTYWIEGEDKIWRGFLAIHQGGEKIEPWYTKEEPHGLPDLVKTVVDDEVHWDGSERRDFFLKLVTDKILPKIKEERPLSGAGTIEPVVAEQKEEVVPEPTVEDVPEYPPDDDLPF